MDTPHKLKKHAVEIPSDLVTLTQITNRNLREIAHRLGVLSWTSLQFNANTESKWHADDYNIDASIMATLGDFHGGEFQLEFYPPIDLRGRAISFQGSTAIGRYRSRGQTVSPS